MCERHISSLTETIKNINGSKLLALSLNEARAALLSRLRPLGQEQLPLLAALHRVCAASLVAENPSPSFAQSRRDGFALAAQSLDVEGQQAIFQIIGEAAAGSNQRYQVQAGQALSIMTGAAIPLGAVRVVALERCQVQGKRLSVPLAALAEEATCIHQQGQDIHVGQTLVAAGTRLLPDHLYLLAENSGQQVQVSRQPRVVVVCTGSELVEAGETLGRGQKISGNSVLLAALLHAQQCCCVGTATAPDHVERCAAVIQEVIERHQPDLLITTGGLGPGKFDYTQQVFHRLGAKLLCTSLNIRPGKGTLLGMLGELPFFALPGPPPAVRLLFYELLLPALRCLQREKQPNEALLEARLAQALPLHKNKAGKDLILKAARAWWDAQGQLWVRAAQSTEAVNAIIHLKGQENDRVQLRLLRSLD